MTSPKKVLAVAYESWSFTTGSNYTEFPEKILRKDGRL